MKKMTVTFVIIGIVLIAVGSFFIFYFPYIENKKNGDNRDLELLKQITEIRGILKNGIYFEEEVERITGMNPTKLKEYIVNQSKNSKSNYVKALSHYNLGQFNEALESFYLALEFSPNEKDIAHIHSYIGEIRLVYIINLIESEKHVKLAYQIFNNLDESLENYDLYVKAINLSNYAIILGKKLKFEKALELHFESLKIRKKLAESKENRYLIDLSKSYMNIGVIYKNNPKLGAAKPYFENALIIARECAISKKDYHLVILAQILNNLGNLSSDDGEISSANKYFLESLNILSGLAKEYPEFYLLTFITAQSNYANYGGINQNSKIFSYDKIEKLFLGTINNYEKIRSKFNCEFEYANCLNNIAGFYSKHGKINEALIYYEKALIIRRKLSIDFGGLNDLKLADTLFGIASTYAVGEFDFNIALEKVSEAHSIYSSYKDSNIHSEKWAKECVELINFLKSKV